MNYFTNLFKPNRQKAEELAQWLYEYLMTHGIESQTFIIIHEQQFKTTLDSVKFFLAAFWPELGNIYYVTAQINGTYFYTISTFNLNSNSTTINFSLELGHGLNASLLKYDSLKNIVKHLKLYKMATYYPK